MMLVKYIKINCGICVILVNIYSKYMLFGCFVIGKVFRFDFQKFVYWSLYDSK